MRFSSGSQILQLKVVPGIHRLVLTLGCMLESPGELCKIPMSRIHPWAIKSDPLLAGAMHQYFLKLSVKAQHAAKFEIQVFSASIRDYLLSGPSHACLSPTHQDASSENPSAPGVLFLRTQ